MQQSQLCKALPHLKCSKLKTAAPTTLAKKVCTHTANIAKKFLYCVKCCQVHKHESSTASATPKQHKCVKYIKHMNTTYKCRVQDTLVHSIHFNQS